MRDGGERMPRFCIFTDATGPFFTVVTEAEVEDFAAWEGGIREAMGQPWMGEWFSRMMPLVESGSREFHHIVGKTAAPGAGCAAVGRRPGGALPPDSSPAGYPSRFVPTVDTIVHIRKRCAA